MVILLLFLLMGLTANEDARAASSIYMAYAARIWRACRSNSVYFYGIFSPAKLHNSAMVKAFS